MESIVSLPQGAAETPISDCVPDESGLQTKGKNQRILPDIEEIRRTLAVIGTGGVMELRAPKAGPDHTISGYFSDHGVLAHAAVEVDGKAPGLYVTLNPVDSALLSRAENQVKPLAKGTTTDADITRRTWMLVDCDPRRPSGISSTDQEHETALQRARDIRAYLRDKGWPEPVLADSGNGGHLLYRVDLPNDDHATNLVKRCLEALATRFTDDSVDVDRSVFNASRISKLYGTVARKGDNTPERPHRLSRILEQPADISLVPIELLEELAASVPAATRTGRACASPISGIIRDGEKHRTSVSIAGTLRRRGCTADEIYAALLEVSKRFESPVPPENLRAIADDIEKRYEPAAAYAGPPNAAATANAADTNTKPAAPKVELLDEPPPALSRPLDIVGGVGYGAAWLYVKKTITETTGKNGEIVRLDPPKVETKRKLFVIRNDGRMFGPAGDDPLDALGFEVHLNEAPRDEKLWRMAGVRAYRGGKRPDYVAVFNRLVAAYDHYLDFGRSVGDQKTMCEFSACASLTTWFSPAFTVLGYFWPNGDKGAGKTKWGTIWANTSYLGQVLLSSGSFAAVRDLADYGAALLFDDAEIIADPKKCDPDKRELLLAGNRRGAAIPIKEPSPEGGWITRWVNAFCPRAFTAIRTPDPVLASRALAIPLVRTADVEKGNADPANTATWPCDLRQLRDDLWATALALLPEAEALWREFDSETCAVGREFEPWRAILAIARLFDRYGVTGLEERMRGLTDKYGKEKQENLNEDRTVMVIQALLNLADITDVLDVADIKDERVGFSATTVATKVKALQEGEGDEGEKTEEGEKHWASSRSTGRMLARLRLKPERENNRSRDRKWTITNGELLGLARAYGIVVEDRTKTKSAIQPPSPENVRNVQNVRNVRSEAKPVIQSPSPADVRDVQNVRNVQTEDGQPDDAQAESDEFEETPVE